MREVWACARIALLYMLFSFYGATTAEYDLPGEAEADLKRHWSERRHVTIRLLPNVPKPLNVTQEVRCMHQLPLWCSAGDHL